MIYSLLAQQKPCHPERSAFIREANEPMQSKDPAERLVTTGILRHSHRNWGGLFRENA
jgi:hypothetical protein